MGKPLGSLWERYKNGALYYTGVIEINGQKQKIVVFKNNNQKSEKSPQMFIFPERPREENVGTQPPAYNAQTPQNSYQNAPSGALPPNQSPTPSFLSVKQIGRLYAIARANRWPREAVDQKVLAQWHYKPEHLDKPRYDEACAFFGNNPYTVQQANSIQSQKAIPNYAPQTNQTTENPPDWVTEDLPF